MHMSGVFRKKEFMQYWAITSYGDLTLLRKLQTLIKNYLIN